MLKFHMSKDKHQLEPNDIFLDNLAQKKEQELGISSKRKEVKISQKKFLSLFSLFFILIFFLFLFTFYFQAFRVKNFQALANQNKYLSSSLTAGRGVIYDNSGKQLASNRVVFNLYLDLEKATNEELEEIKNIIDFDSGTEKDNIFFKENIDIETLIFLKSRSFPFVFYEQSLVREYENPEVFSHLLGYIGKISKEELERYEDYSLQDYIGKMGLERSYDNYLRKRPGELLAERDSLGNIISEKIVSLPEPGYNLELWIDSDLQIKLYQELEEVLNNIGSNRAAAVAIDPKTGGILSMVSVPGYNNNLFSTKDYQKIQETFEDPRQPFFNRAISGLYATGSTIKPLTGVAALEEGIISSKKQINCKGQITVPHSYDPSIIYNFRDLRVHGLSDMQKAIAESCNVYFYIIGGGYEGQKGLGSSKIKEYLETFGWGKITGIDIPGEKRGFIPSPEWKREIKNENWWTGDTYNFSIGQGDLDITPLQVANSYSIIANKGTFFSPKIVKNILDQEKNIIKKIKPEIIQENLFLEKNLETVREGMRRAVTGEGVPNASARILQSLPVSSAAKTGTAQTSRENRYHNWITVFAPYDDPEIVLTIIIEDVEGIQLASSLVAQRTLDWYFKEKYDN